MYIYMCMKTVILTVCATHHTHTLHISNMHRSRGGEKDTETGRQGDRGTDRGLDSERHGVEKRSGDKH